MLTSKALLSNKIFWQIKHIVSKKLLLHLQEQFMVKESIHVKNMVRFFLLRDLIMIWHVEILVFNVPLVQRKSLWNQLMRRVKSILLLFTALPKSWFSSGSSVKCLVPRIDPYFEWSVASGLVYHVGRAFCLLCW